MRASKRYFATAAAACSLWLLTGVPGSRAEESESFYAGKTITVVQGRTPGGTGDIRARAIFPYLEKYIPGHPTIVSQYIPGGGGTAAANYLANKARRNGLTIANIGTGLYQNALFGARGVRYRLDEFTYFGSPYPGGPYVLLVRPGLGLNTVEKLKAYPNLRFANRSVGHGMYIMDRLMAYILGLKNPKWVLGYSSSEISLALEHGEADLRTNGIPNVIREQPHWSEEGYLAPFIKKNTKGRGAEIFPAFPQDRPTLEEFADTEMKREILKLHDFSRPGSQVFLTHKDNPAKALKILKAAFDKSWSDLGFRAEYEKLVGEPSDPMTGKEIEQVLAALPKDPKVYRVFKQIIGAGPLPPSR